MMKTETRLIDIWKDQNYHKSEETIKEGWPANLTTTNK